MLDPTINYQFQKMKEDLKQAEKNLKSAQEEVEAIQFSQQSILGKKLMAKCRLLQEENEEFGQKLAEGRIHKLECEIALQKEYIEELKQSLNESNDYIMQLDEEIENLQATNLQLVQQLKGKT